MIQSRRQYLRLAAGAMAACWETSAAEPDFSRYTDDDMEKFLKSAQIVSVKEIGHGVTKPLRAEMTLGDTKHSAQIQTIDKDLPDFFGAEGKPVPMKDSWRFNVAAYKIDRLLDIKMVAVAVARPYKNKPAAFSWWVDDVQFEEVDRIKQGLQAPDPEKFERQRAVSKVFDELIINIDRNLSNLLITKSWDLVLIDHSRSFTPYHGIRNTENLTRCSRRLLEKMKSMTASDVSRAVGPHLTQAEIRAMMARRDRIVEYFAKAVQEKGDENILFS